MVALRPSRRMSAVRRVNGYAAWYHTLGQVDLPLTDSEARAAGNFQLKRSADEWSRSEVEAGLFNALN